MDTAESRDDAWRERATISIPEAAAILGVSEATAYRAANAGTLPVVKVQSRRVVPTAALARLLELDPASH